MVPVGEGVWRVWRVLEGLEGFGAFGAFAGWQTAALKAYRKPLLWPWPWGACWGSGLGPGVPAGDGVWRVWRVLEGLESFGMFGAFAGWQTAALKPIESHCCGLGPGVPVGEVALALGCLLGRVFGGFGWRVLEGLESFENFGPFAGWQTAALKAHRKPLLWPWPWGACSGSGLGPGVLAGEGVWRVWSVLEGLEGLEGLERLQAGKRQL